MSLKYTDNGIELQEGKLLLSDLSCWFGLAPTTLGKSNPKAKEKKMKIKDITANDGRITLEGRIVNSECKETKTGKGMLIFELYDGTGILTCKSFAKDAQEGNEVLEKIKNI